ERHEVDEAEDKKRVEWRRTQRSEMIEVAIENNRLKPRTIDVPNSDGLKIVVSLRSVTPTVAQAIAGENEQCDCRSLSVFLVNQRGIEAAEIDRKDERYLFQASLRVVNDDGFLPRPNL